MKKQNLLFNQILTFATQIDGDNLDELQEPFVLKTKHKQ
jgi:hypothetical protein